MQRLPKIVGNESAIRDWALTGRNVPAPEAMQFGLISRVLENKDELMKAALETAKVISSKSPVATVAVKNVMLYARDHTVEDGLLQVSSIHGSKLLEID